MDDTVWSSFHTALLCNGVHLFAKHKWDSKLNRFHLYFNSFILLLTLIFTTGYIVTETDDVAIWIEGICIWMTGVISYITAAVILTFKKEFRQFLEEMAFKDAMLDIPFIYQVINSSHEETKLRELKDMVLSTQAVLLKYTVLYLKLFSASVLSTAFLYVLDAVWQMIVREEDSMRLFGFGMWFPWKLDDFNIYIASFVFHVYAGFLAGMSYPTFQSIIVLLMGQIIRQLKVITYILENLDDLIVELVKERNGRWQFYCTSVLSQCIDHYITIKKFSNRMNLICRTFYLAMIIDAMMLVCVCSVKIAITHRFTPELIKFVMHEFFFIMMVLLFCSLGQQVQNECEKLESAVLEKWYIFDKKHRDNIKIFHFAICQKMPIHIFGSIPLSLPTFTWFIKTGMSFFTLAMSVLEE